METPSFSPPNVSGSLQGISHVSLRTSSSFLRIHNISIIFCLWLTTDVTKGTTVASLFKGPTEVSITEAVMFSSATSRFPMTMVSLRFSLLGPLETKCGLTITAIREGSWSFYATLCDTDLWSQYFLDNLLSCLPSSSLSSFHLLCCPSPQELDKWPESTTTNSSELKEKMKNLLYGHRGILRGYIQVL